MAVIRENKYNMIDKQARKDIERLKGIIINVKDYGAKGDGSSIDKDSIQSVLDLALTRESLTVYFPAGKYVLNGPMQVYSNTHLILDEQAIITRQQHGALLMNGEYEGDIQYGNIHIEGGIWDAHNIVNEYSGSVHFVLGNADNITINNCVFMNNHGNHALDIAGCENVTVRDCSFIGQLPDPNTSRYYVEAIQIAEFTEEGQPAWGDGWNNRPCKNVLIDNCFFDKNYKDERFSGYGSAVGTH